MANDGRSRAIAPAARAAATAEDRPPVQAGIVPSALPAPSAPVGVSDAPRAAASCADTRAAASTGAASIAQDSAMTPRKRNRLIRLGLMAILAGLPRTAGAASV